MNRKGNIRRKDLLYPELSYLIVGSAFDVSNELGGGHHEKYYQRALADAFRKKNLRFWEQVGYPIYYSNKIIGRKVLDFLVEDKWLWKLRRETGFQNPI